MQASFSAPLRRWLGLATLGFMPSCFPYALPPAKVSVGSVVAGTPVVTSSGDVERPEAALVRVGLHPLDVAERELPLDVGLGYEVEFVPSGRAPSVQGGYLEIGAYPISAKLGERLRLRLGAYGTFDGLVREGSSGAGFGGSLGGLLELTGRVDGETHGVSSDGTVNAGYALGRWGIGVFGSGSMRELDGNTQPGAAVGVSVRIPLLAGVVCCAWSGSDDSDDDHAVSGSSSSPPRRLVRTPAKVRPQRTPASPRPKE